MAKQIYVFSSDVDAARLTELGRLCIHFALLETKVEQCIWALRGHDRKQGRVLTRRQFFSKRCTKLCEEATARLAPDSDALKFFLRVADHAAIYAEDRNFFVHGLWAFNTEKGKEKQIVAVSYFTKLEGSGTEVTAKGLSMLTANIVKLCNQVDRGIKKHLGVEVP